MCYVVRGVLVGSVARGYCQLETGAILWKELDENMTQFLEKSVLVSHMTTKRHTLCSGISLVSCCPTARAVQWAQNRAVFGKL